MTHALVAGPRAIRPIRSAVGWLAAIALAAAPAAAQGGAVRVHLLDGRGAPTPTLDAGDTVAVRITGLSPRTAYDLVLVAQPGDAISFARTAAGVDGEVGPLVLWYDGGITGPDPAGDGNAGEGFADLAEAEQWLAGHRLALEIREQDLAAPGTGPMVAQAAVPVRATRASPWLEFTDLHGQHRNAFESGRDTLFVHGENFAAGSVVELDLVADRADWQDGDAFEDLSGYRGAANPHTVHLGPADTSFLVPVWATAYQHAGRFDLVARTVGAGGVGERKLRADDRLAHGFETGIHVKPPRYAAPPDDLVRDLAGVRTRKKLYPGFEFRTTFLRHDSVYAALDPTDIPPDHTGGDYAATYVVAAKNAAEWRADRRLRDITETVEIGPVKQGTLELSIDRIWVDADPAGIESIPCDVVMDFIAKPQSGGRITDSTGGTRFTKLFSTAFDGLYTRGRDIIDKLGKDGFYVVDDPSESGPYPVGRTSYDYPDAYDIPWGQYADKNVDMRAVVAYPAATAGNDTAVWGSTEKFPIIFILHGNHIVCLGSNPCDHNCPAGSRVPNHEGYDYLLDLWASHGMIAVSIDGYDVTCLDDRFVERAALILEHIRWWEDWNNPSVPDTTFNGRFWDRIDVDKVGIAGHSRGGEGAAGAVQINQDVGLGHQIKACCTIAPTDFNSAKPPGGGPTAFVVKDTPFFNIMGSRDGDVWDCEGAQTYDRASPRGHRATKTQAFIYGAEHNSWNTVWIDPSWGGSDDSSGGLTHQQQQDTGRVYITTFWMAFLQGRTEMLAFHKGQIDSPKLSAVKTYWSFEDGDRLDVDNFQDKPVDKNTNSLGGAVTCQPAPLTYQENSLRPGAYDGSFYHDTDGLIVGWNQVTTYTSEIPDLNGDVSKYSHLHIRAAQIWDNNTLNTGPQSFLVNLEDANGVHQTVDVSSDAFAPIPVSYNHPFGGRKSMMSSIRIPLRAFTQDSSGLDLTHVTKVVITFQSTGLLAIDDIQFTR